MKKLIDVVNEKTGAGKVKPDLRGFGKNKTPDFVLTTFNEMMKKRASINNI